VEESLGNWKAFERIRALIVLALLATGLPWVGARLVAAPEGTVASFHWPIFLIYALAIVACTGPLLRRIAKWRPEAEPALTARRPFPWWGWVGLAVTAAAWIFAWTRFRWFEPLQRYTLTPLWLGYILTINALALRHGGRCLLRDRPACFVILFPASAAFWWYFEYINRYVGNWHYVGAESIGDLEYFVHATISFSTVLPAVVGTREWLASFPRLERGLSNLWRVPIAESRATAWVFLLLGMAGFLAIGVWPGYAYPIVWVAPVLILTALQSISRLPNPLANLTRGDWRGIGLPALAALFCGFFWELWNWQSLAHWEYSIPFVHRFLVFEMPILGYAGYLPFGIACAAVADLICARLAAASSSGRG
jgi:hypothetical protein